MNNSTSQNHRFKELDALRGIAAIMVVFYHFCLWKAIPFYVSYIRLGNTGVDLFFMISGFVIFMSLEHITTSAQFIFNRFIRIYPTYWTVVTFTFLLISAVSFSNDHNLAKIYFPGYLANMSMFQYYLKTPNLDGSYWTMIIEMTFYILMVSLFQFKLLRFVIAIGITICLAIQVLLFTGNLQLVTVMIIWVQFLMYAPLFFSGILFFKIISDRGNQLYYYTGIGFLFVCQVLSYKILDRQLFISQTEYLAMLTIYYLLFILFVNDKLRFIVSKPTLFFGKISYALYLIHQYVSVKFLIPNLMDRWHMKFVLTVIISFAVSVVLAWLITDYIETPIRRLAKKHFYEKKLKGSTGS